MRSSVTHSGLFLSVTQRVSLIRMTVLLNLSRSDVVECINLKNKILEKKISTGHVVAAGVAI